MMELYFKRIRQAVLCSFCFMVLLTVQGQNSGIGQIEKSKINTYINETIKKYEITGVAIAILKDGEVIYKNYLGKSNLEYNIPISENSLFRLHSLSKVFVSVGIFQLIEKNKISLEDKISKYLKDLPEGWRDVQIKHLLSHSSGLPDVRELESDDEQEIATIIYERDKKFSLGDKADYNQTNFWLLNRIVREITKLDFKEAILKGQFDVHSSKTDFSNIQEIIPHRISEYKPDSKGNLRNFYFKVPAYMYGAAGLHISLNEFIEWDQKLENENLLTANSQQKMFTPFQYKTGKGFTQGGLDLRNINGFATYGFNGGGLVNYKKIPSKKITIIWLTNGYRIPYSVEKVTNDIAGIIDKNLVDITPSVAQFLQKSFTSKKVKTALHDFKEMKTKYPFINYENVLNNLGYWCMKEKKIAQAIAIFKLNTKEYPNSANTFDSLGEAYFVNKENDKAKKYYQKAISLGGTRGNAKMMLTKIDKLKK